MQSKININISVDSVEALSKKTLTDNIFVMDNSSFGSQGQGTATLATACAPGQEIHWVATAIDLQTPVCIQNICFLPDALPAVTVATGTDDSTTAVEETEDSKAEQPAELMSQLDLYTWTGYLPYCMVPAKPYRYQLVLQIGNGKNSVLAIDTLSLIWE